MILCAKILKNPLKTKNKWIQKYFNIKSIYKPKLLYIFSSNEQFKNEIKQFPRVSKRVKYLVINIMKEA